ncbi:hypothetical protein PRZ48_001663 [Zasmidium cellare]|uniref:Uncharacterized protein n=1 Tax=Zasmidium cellare TaxID=395010 RepID=A0ABR0F3R2_ZASCE|nr:hypothetical protein PRZ48_001663 [Zasmidium cellare]
MSNSIAETDAQQLMKVVTSSKSDFNKTYELPGRVLSLNKVSPDQLEIVQRRALDHLQQARRDFIELLEEKVSQSKASVPEAMHTVPSSYQSFGTTQSHIIMCIQQRWAYEDPTPVSSSAAIQDTNLTMPPYPPQFENDQLEYLKAIIKSPRSSFPGNNTLDMEIKFNEELTPDNLTIALQYAHNWIERVVSEQIAAHTEKIQILENTLRRSAQDLRRMIERSSQSKRRNLAIKITQRWDIEDYTAGMTGRRPAPMPEDSR